MKHTKYILSFSLIALILLTFTVYSGNSATPSSNTLTPPLKETSDTTMPDNGGHDMAPDDNSEPTQETKDMLEAGFELMKNERLGGIYYSMPLQDVIALLGQPNVEHEPELWGADGMYHWTVSYSKVGLQINIVNKADQNEGATIFSILAESHFDGKTEQDIQIRSTRDDVLGAYADVINSEESSGNNIVAGSVFGGVIFIMDEADRVKSIFVGASAE